MSEFWAAIEDELRVLELIPWHRRQQTVHRADLQALLYRAALDAGATVHFGRKCDADRLAGWLALQDSSALEDEDLRGVDLVVAAEGELPTKSSLTEGK